MCDDFSQKVVDVLAWCVCRLHFGFFSQMRIQIVDIECAHQNVENPIHQIRRPNFRLKKFFGERTRPQNGDVLPGNFFYKPFLHLKGTNSTPPGLPRSISLWKKQRFCVFPTYLISGGCPSGSHNRRYALFAESMCVTKRKTK